MADHAKPKRTQYVFRRFGINTLLMLTTLVATFIASETNRYRHEKTVEQSLALDCLQHSQRFDGINADGFFASTLTKLIGPRWNQVVTSVVLSNDEMDEHVFDSVTQLRHLRTVGIMRLELTKDQYESLAGIKSLQWLYFVNTNIDSATLESLRKKMPNSFVTGFEYRDTPYPR